MVVLSLNRRRPLRLVGAVGRGVLNLDIGATQFKEGDIGIVISGTKFAKDKSPKSE